MSNNEHFNQVKDAISATASILFNNESVENTILSSNSSYKKLLQKTIRNLDGDSSNALINLHNFQNELDKEFNHLEGKEAYLRKSGDDYFTNDFVDSKTGFKVMTYLNDRILKENLLSERDTLLLRSSEQTTDDKSKKSIENDQKSSLFQGFEASLPIVDKVIEKKKKSQGLLTESKEEENNGDFLSLLINDLPDFETQKPFNTARISRSYSLKYLKGLSDNLLRTINLLFIQKDIIHEEREDIENKLEIIKEKHKYVLKKLKTAETNELYLENVMSLVKERINFIEEYDLEMEITAVHESSQSSGNVTQETLSDTETKQSNFNKDSNNINDEQEAVKTSKVNDSVFQKLNSKNKDKKNRLQKFFDENSRVSKRVPSSTQHHFESGSNIFSLPRIYENGISCLDFDMPFGALCTAGYIDPNIKIWDLTRQVQMAELNGHLATINCMQTSPHYSLLITGSKDATLKLWDIKLASQLYQENTSSAEDSYNSCIHTFEAHVDEVTALSFDTINMVSGSQDKTVRQWDLLTGKCVQTIDLSFINTRTQSKSLINNLQESQLVGTLQCFDAALATGTKDGIVRLWDLRSGKAVRTLEGHTDSISCLKFDSYSLVTGSLDKRARIWDLRTGTLTNAFAFDSPITSLDFNSSKIVFSTNEPVFRVYDKRNDQHWTCGPNANEADQDKQTPNITHIKLKDNYAISGSDDGSIDAWRV